MDEKILIQIEKFQKNEITEYKVYKSLSEIAKDLKNKKILEAISEDELRHYNFWKKYTKKEIPPDQFKVSLYTLISKILGLSFTVKLMEIGEGEAQITYGQFVKIIPEVKNLITDEDRHEMETLKLIHDQYLKYAGSIVLGLSDALVELTGALAGLTFALQNSKLIAISGLVTGVAAAFSMGASEYLSLKAEEKGKSEAVRSSIYTGIVYIIVVILLVAPYIFLTNIYLSLILTLLTGILIIVLFSIYVSVVQQVSFIKQFSEMSILSLGVATITFTLGLLLRKIFGIEV